MRTATVPGRLPPVGRPATTALALAQGRQIPIILVTAFPEERMQARAIEAGALGFLGKPFDSSKLVELIDKALEVGRKT